MVTIKSMKMQEYDKNDKNCKNIGKNEIFNKKTQRDPQTARVITLDTCFDKDADQVWIFASKS